MNKQSQDLTISTDCDKSIANYWVTPHLRYIRKKLPNGDITLLLEQMWQGSDGSQIWKLVQIFNDN